MFSNSLCSPLVSVILNMTILWSEIGAIMMDWRSMKASTSFVKVFSSLLLLSTICPKQKLFVTSSCKLTATFSGVLPGFTSYKTPSSLLMVTSTRNYFFP